ncbi:MAG: acyl CoA:acetate/3-ketoacid CoA transferase, partial [Clostridium sp.]|nr:acyl CoA:acetate/3-ketoacid CoA transferase [Clostridium sp.]
SLTGEYRVVTEEQTGRMPLTERKVIARRAADELGENDICNLGFGMPDGVAAVVREERGKPPLLSVEQGIIGGIPQGGSNFGLVRNPAAILDQPYQFDWYDGGGLDVTVLSFAEFDRHGNVNVSKFGGRINGVGGFVNISQGAKKVVFVGTFTAGGFRAQVDAGLIRITSEGRSKKLVSQVEQISFSGNYARENGQKVVFVTERAVFELTAAGVKLTEIAPGVDLKQDILDQMEFVLVMDGEIRMMPARYFEA